jgi:hypothetical protein
MSTDLNNLAKRTPMFSSTYKLARKIKSELNPLFSISSAQFCAFAQFTFPPNPFIIYCLRTFSDNYRGVGVLCHLLKRPSSDYRHFRRKRTSKPFIFNQFQRSAQLIENKHFQVHLFSYSCALFSCNSFVCLTYTKQPRGVPRNCPILGFSVRSNLNTSPLLRLSHATSGHAASK